MRDRARAVYGLCAILVMAYGLCGCGTINTFVAHTMADYIPEWAGGLPASAPPRPGTPEYDEWQRRREADRQSPNPETPNETAPANQAAADSN
jgi:hypothetical protein